MLSLILSVVISQYKQVDNSTVPSNVKDLTFIMIQEDWVYQNTKKIVWRWEHALSEDETDLLERLDCDKIRCRRHAKKELVALNFEAAKLLAWGIHAKSEEVKSVCNLALVKLYKCQTCRGTGIEKREQNFDNQEDVENMEVTPWTPRCRVCFGSGSYLWYEDSDKDGNEIIVQRNLFK